MPAENFFTDNPDLRFHIEKGIDWRAILEMKQTLQDPNSPCSSIDEAVETFNGMMADPIGDLAANRIAPRAWDVDNIGCQLVDGQVLFPEGLQRNLKELREAQLMGLTLPTAFGGLNFPETFYTAAIEVISRADASLMNFFGLQGGIAATISEFGSDVLKEKYLPGMAAGDLTGAMARDLRLFRARLARAILTRAELWGADLRRADLTDADLRDANLRAVDLTGADLARAQIAGANLRNACICNTVMPDGRTEVSGCRACDRPRTPDSGEKPR